ncbi:MAG: VCBS domain-containing protein, partial [Pseudomonadota bacterium]
MNYVQKFDSGLFSAQGAFSGAGESFSVDVHPRSHALGHGGPDTIVVPDAHLLFSGDYKRSGLDLVLSKDGHEFVARDYFRGESRSVLASPDGASLSGSTVEALAGQVDYAQAGGAIAPAKIIGQVTKVTGSATAVRNGVSITLNVGDNVHKGDVVQSGSDSSLGITFIDGTVFGLSSNARMVLNEMIYDPAGSSNASLLTLVQGTISFVAGATAKTGDMKVETPTATMGIRGTAVLVEIDFDVFQPGLAPPVSFRILVEPNGETGEYVLLDRLTGQPIATVNQPGTKTVVNGQGAVTFFPSAEIPANAQRLINEIFTLKFTDANPKYIGIPPLDTITPQSFLAKLPDGTPIDQLPIIRITLVLEPVAPPPPSGGNTRFHLNIPPDLLASSNQFTERLLTTGNTALDTVSGVIHFDDINPEDRPTVSAQFNSYVYRDAQQEVILTSSLTLEQLAAIQAVQVPLSVVQHPDNTNVGDGTWTYRVPDQALDFLAEGETLTLIYMARVDTNYIGYNTVVFTPFKITITGSNDLPTAAATGSGIIELDGTNNPDINHAEGVITFTDVDLTDRPTVTAPFANYVYTAANGSVLTLTPAQQAALAATLTLTPAQNNTNNGSVAWSYDVADSNFDFIAAGETLVLTYHATVDDGHGGIVTVPLTLTVSVNGTNDIPTITATSDSFIELVGTTGNASPDHAGGTITFTDVDLTDRPTVSAAYASFFTYSNAQNVDITSTLTTSHLAAIAAVHPVLSLEPLDTNANNGKVAWSYELPDNSFDFLAQGETLSLSYTATVDDGHGGIASTPFTVTITGSNDVPVAIGDANATDAVVESGVDPANTPSAGDPAAAGNVLTNDTDVDINHVLTVAAVAGGAGNVGMAVTGFYGSVTIGADGSYTYTLNNADPDTQALAHGAVATDVFSYTVTDEFGATSTADLTITITGTNDAPVASGDGNA